jgi:hypothetical protein
VTRRFSRAWKLGYSSLHNYAVQNCSQTGRWADDTRRVAVRLGSLPALPARGCALYDQYEQEQAWQRAHLEQQARWVEEREEQCEKNFAGLLEGDGEQEAPTGEDETDSLLCEPRHLCSAAELHSYIGELADKLARWDLHVGTLADKMH